MLTEQHLGGVIMSGAQAPKMRFVRLKLSGFDTKMLPTYYRISEHTSYGTLSEQLSSQAKKSLSVLDENFGPTCLPYWIIPEPSQIIPMKQRELWIIPRQEHCLFALMRTPTEDRLTLLDAEAIHKTTCDGLFDNQLIKNSSITIHGKNEDIQHTRLDPKLLNSSKIKTYPTILFINCCQEDSPIEFLSFTSEERSSIPAPLTSTYARAKELEANARSVIECSYQAIYFSRVMLHLIVSLSHALQNYQEEIDPNKLESCLILDK
ncbi:hypothetical protein CPB86DRAFT_13062 [Serendipita vermifera]|nr:hypothetical protein CPB86DRAFT_13062 [Serendipita vermifera]